MPDIKVQVTDAIIKEIIAATRQIMITYKLGNTALIDSTEWTYKDNMFMLIANDYFYWVDTGRKPRARKVPIEALIKWIIKKNLIPKDGTSVNSLAYAIQNSIYKVGIKARGMTYPIIGETLDILEQYLAEDLSVQIASQIATEMTFTLGKQI